MSEVYQSPANSKWNGTTLSPYPNEEGKRSLGISAEDWPGFSCTG
jgi:hypothetical protein